LVRLQRPVHLRYTVCNRRIRNTPRTSGQRPEQQYNPLRHHRLQDVGTPSQKTEFIDERKEIKNKTMNNKIKAALYSCICVLAAGCIIGGGRYYREHFCGGEARLRGVVKNSEEKQLLLIPESGDAMDTIALKTDGSFDFRFAPAEPFGVYMLYIPDAGIPIYLYARKGARIRVAYDASDIERTPVIRGNVRAECEIIRRMIEEFTGMDIEEIARMSFTEYRREIMEEYTVIANLLKQSKDRAFAEATLKELNALRDYHLYAYRASYKLFVSPEDDVPDEAFWEF